MVPSFFHPEIYRKRRQALKAKVRSGVILLPGNRLTPMNYTDNTYPFRQDSNFLYFFGISVENLIGIIDIDNDTDYLLGVEQTVDDIVWKGNIATLSELASMTAADKYLPYEKIGDLLNRFKNSQRPIHWVTPYQAELTLLLMQWLNVSSHEISRGQSNVLINAIADLRIVKDDQEIEFIERAVNISREMHVEIMKAAKQGMREYELLSIVESIAIKHNARTAYPAILTTQGQTLHNHYHGNTLQPGDLVLCDAGAELTSGYCGDITRTFPVDKTFTRQQADIYEIVLSALTKSELALKPGINFKDIHLLACKEITIGLQGLGLMKGDVDASVEAGAHALFFQCGLGHLIGLDVHDMENLGEDLVGYDSSIPRSDQFGLKSLRLARKLQKGFVLTVEPGIYFIPYLIDLWKEEKRFSEFINYEKVERFKSFGGIRIEDNYLITDNSFRILGEPIPRTISAVEALRNS